MKGLRFFVLGFFIFSLFVSGCKKQETTTGPGQAILMNVSPSSLDFGYVAVNSSKDMRFILKNNATSSGNLRGSISVTGNGFNLLSASQFNLAPGESLIVTVRFTPQEGISYSGKVVINHNASNFSTPYEIVLAGFGDATLPRIVSLIQSGWQEFRARNYNTSFVKFDSAVALARTATRYDSLQAEAECGRGWSRAFNRSFSLAKNDLLNALAHQSVGFRVGLNSRAGLALVHHSLNEFSSAIQRALEVLNSDANYTFEYDSRVYHKRLRLVLAQSYYSLGDFQNAARQLDILDPSSAPHSTDPILLLRKIQEMWARL